MSTWLGECNSVLGNKECKYFNNYSITKGIEIYYCCKALRNCTRDVSKCPNIYNYTRVSDFPENDVNFNYYTDDGSNYNCRIDMRNNFCGDSLFLLVTILSFKAANLFILLVLGIMSITCWKGQFITKLIESPNRRIVLVAIIVILHFTSLIFEILLYILNKLDYDVLYQKVYHVEQCFLLLVVILCSLSPVLFTIASILVCFNKSDAEIINNNAQINQPLI